MPVFGVQDGDYFRDWPQPLGVFREGCEVPTWGGANVLGNVLEISKSGLVLGWMPRAMYRSGSEASGSDDWTDADEAASDARGPLEISGLARSTDDVWAVGLRLARCAG